ncbi:hypothetical protein [Fischerella sp. PCC 9605]|uniref:hypothetical protein n=1 Tax=Fischerella sp. PCC 9605 TaxID=1173024 RepID=UPI001E5F1754|nr:hypothetical protein [Fischerella sp. PCC 9605]
MNYYSTNVLNGTDVNFNNFNRSRGIIAEHNNLIRYLALGGLGAAGTRGYGDYCWCGFQNHPAIMQRRTKGTV